MTVIQTLADAERECHRHGDTQHYRLASHQRSAEDPEESHNAQRHSGLCLFLMPNIHEVDVSADWGHDPCRIDMILFRIGNTVRELVNITPVLSAFIDRQGYYARWVLVGSSIAVKTTIWCIMLTRRVRSRVRGRCQSCSPRSASSSHVCSPSSPCHAFSFGLGNNPLDVD